MIKKCSIWHSVHLYYEHPQDEFLLNAVLPFLRQLNDSGIALDNYFFIRYFDDRHHIRLRLKSGEDERLIRKSITEYFNKYFMDYPSKGLETSEHNQNRNKVSIPDNSLRFIAYEPEFSRYGGTEGMEIAEEHFRISTDAVLNSMKEHESWNYETALGTGIQLLISLSYAAGMNIEKTSQFFSHYRDICFYTFFQTESYLSKDEVKEKFIPIFRREYERNGDYFRARLGKLIERLESNNSQNIKWFDTWITENTIILTRLRKLFPIGDEHTQNFTDSKFCQILSSYIHMTLNRLGIKNVDEPYLGFVINETLKQI